MNTRRYATLLMMIDDSIELAEHYRNIGLPDVAKELEKNRGKYEDEINANLADTIWYDEEEVDRIRKECDGKWWTTGESNAVNNNYNNKLKER